MTAPTGHRTYLRSIYLISIGLSIWPALKKYGYQCWFALNTLPSKQTRATMCMCCNGLGVHACMWLGDLIKVNLRVHLKTLIFLYLPVKIKERHTCRNAEGHALLSCLDYPCCTKKRSFFASFGIIHHCACFTRACMLFYSVSAYFLSKHILVLPYMYFDYSMMVNHPSLLTRR